MGRRHAGDGFGEGVFGAGDDDFRLADDDFRNEGADVAFSEIGGGFSDEVFKPLRGDLCLLDCDRSKRVCGLRFLRFNQVNKFSAFPFGFAQSFLKQVRICRNALGKCAEQVSDALVHLTELAAKLAQRMVCIAAPRFTPFCDSGDNRLRPRGRQKPARESVERQLVELLFADRDAEFARAAAVQALARTFVIAVGAALAGGHHQGLAAAFAQGKAGQEHLAIRQPRGRLCRSAITQEHLDALKDRFQNYRRNRNLDPFLARTRLAGARIPAIEPRRADIGFVRQDRIDAARIEGLAGQRLIASGVQPFGDIHDAEGTGLAVAFEKKAEYQFDRLSGLGIDGELLLDFVAPLFRRDDLIAERRPRAIPEALARIFLHAALDVLCVLFAPKFIHQRKHSARHISGRSAAGFLRDRLNFDAEFFEFSPIKLKEKFVAEKARETVHQNDVEFFRLFACRIDHRLKFRPLVVARAEAFFDEFRNNFHVARRRVFPHARQLIGN